jgi:GPH family glycoside/pentoside/hexuronide:cation symporter
MTQTTSSGNQVGLATKIAYGIGGLTDSIKTFSFVTFLFFYYTTVLGLPGSLLGLAMSVGLVWDAVIDPLIGHVSDRLTPKFGRRHPFMFVGAVCASASFIAVFNPPAGLSAGFLFAWLMATSLCLRSSNSLFMVPYYALGAELTTDYHERTSISGYRAALVLLGTLGATAAAFLVFLPSNTVTTVDSKFDPASYQAMGIVFGIAMMLVGLTATFGTFRARSQVVASPTSAGMTFRHTVLATFHNRSFRVLVLCSSLSVMAAAINGALAMHFLTYHARIDAGQGFTMYFAAFYGAALAGVCVWVRIARRIEKHHLYAATTLITGIIMSGGYFLVGEGRLFGAGNIWAVVAGNGIGGFFGIAAAVIAPSMMADITAQDELTAGWRRDGIFFGVYSFGQQIATGLAIVIAGVLVDHFAGLVPGQAVQSAQTAERLAMTFSLVPAALLTTAAVVVLRYREPGPHSYYDASDLVVSAERPQAPA